MDQSEFDVAFEEASGRKTQSTAEPEDKEADQPSESGGPNESDKPDKSSEPQNELDLLKAKLEKAQHEERSSANRLSHFMRSENQLRKQVEELTSEVEKLRAKPEAEKQLSDDDANDVLADAPDLSAAVDRRIQRATHELQAKLDEANKRLAEVGKNADAAVQGIEPLQRREREQQQQSVYGQLDTALGKQWREDIKSPAFADWLKTQPQAVQWTYQNGQTFEDGMLVLERYYAKTGAPKQGQPAPESGNERLRNAAGVRSRPAIRQGQDPNDYYGAFAEFTRK